MHKNIKKELSQPIAVLTIPAEDIPIWKNLFTVLYEISGDNIYYHECEGDYDLAKHYYAKQMLNKIDCWNKDKSNDIEVTPMFLYFANYQLQREIHVHEAMDCTEKVRSSCSMCNTLERYKSYLEEKTKEYLLEPERTNIKDMILNYVNSLPVNKRSSMYRKVIKQVNKNRNKKTYNAAPYSY